MKISYAITVCNELEEIKRLVSFLLSNKRTEDEIIILLDHSNGKDEVYRYLLTLPSDIQLYRDTFKGHFADWKNQLTSYCTGDYIFQIDADEIPNLTLIEHLPEILEMNQGVDVLLVPRVNTVEGLTQEHIQKWGWVIDDQGWVNYPDFQWRIYKNTPDIKWVNKVHERLIGYKTISNLPQMEACSLYHPKTIERQEKQNNYYDTL
jgi:glycosyltransferase involved in cell wall biosynthesis